MFTQNIGITGRLIRLTLGIIFSFLAYFYMSWILLAIALFCFFQAVMGWCAFNQLMGINTCSIPKKYE